ncbi:hypothetical protein D3C72_927080 [compost metagenome]
MQGVFDASLLFLHFDFGGSANANHGNAAGQLGHAFLQLFTVVVGRGFFDLDTDLLDASLDRLAVASAVDDRRVFLAHFDALGLAQFSQAGLFQRHAGFFGDHRAARQDGDVFQHGLAAVAEARSLDGGGLQDATDVVHNQGGQRFAFDVFCDDQQRTARLGNLLQHGQQVTDVADLLVENQDKRIFQHGNLLFRAVDEVGRQVAAVELHAFDDVQLVFQRLAVFDGDDAFLANLVHRVSDDLADGGIAVGRDGTDLSDFLAGRDRLGLLLQFSHGGGDSLVDAALQVDRVETGGNVLQAFHDDGLSQHGGGRGAVTGVVGGLGGNVLDQLCADVLELVLQFDFLGDGHAVLGHGRGAERALQHDVATLGAQGGLNSVGENIHAADDTHTGVVTEQYLLGSHFLASFENSFEAGFTEPRRGFRPRG